MGHFYASLETGYTTASVALKRLVGFSAKNHFYKANRELGRVFKTEQIHQLSRDVAYGKQGKISARDLQEQKNSCSCLTLILACIIYWQAREINRVVSECNWEENGIDISMIQHISPIEWDNVILYGQYVIDKSRIKP